MTAPGEEPGGKPGEPPPPASGAPEAPTPAELERYASLDSFSKLQTAQELIGQALAQSPNLQVLQLDVLLRELASGMQILASKDSDLDVAGLCLKHEWFIGQSFYVRATVQDPSAPAFAVLSGEDIPEGVVITGHRPVPNLALGQTVGLSIEIRRKHHTPAWHIRTVDTDPNPNRKWRRR